LHHHADERKTKFALISHILPPSETAHAAIIHRLLRDLHPESYCLLSGTDYLSGQVPEYSDRLPGRYYHLPAPYQLTRGYRFGLERARGRVNRLMAVLLRARHIARILRRERCDRVVVCTGGREVFDFPAGYLASRMVGARFYAYLLDQYAHMVTFVLGGGFFQRFEPPVMRGAAAIIVPNEFMAEEVQQRYGVRAVIIRNTCDVSAYADAGAGESNEGEGVKIVYTGGVGPFHYDALTNMLTAIDLLGREEHDGPRLRSARGADRHRDRCRGLVVRDVHDHIRVLLAEAEMEALELTAQIADHLCDGIPTAAAALRQHARDAFLGVRRFHEELGHDDLLER